MSSKAYSPKQRLEIRDKLLQVGLKRYAKEGIQAVRLVDIVQEVGISKPFFYKFFSSVQDFVIEVIDYQWGYLSHILSVIEEDKQMIWQDKVRILLDKLIHHRNHGILIMTQDEEMWVRDKVSDEIYTDFMHRQISFFNHLLDLWDIPDGACDPRVLANLMLSIIVTYNSGKETFPFFYLDVLEETAKTQSECLITYLESIKTHSIN